MIANHELVDSVTDIIAPVIDYLADRWHDEQENENWMDYVFYMKGVFKKVKNATFVSLHTNPFGCKWIGEDGYKRYTYIDHNEIITRRIEN